MNCLAKTAIYHPAKNAQRKCWPIWWIMFINCRLIRPTTLDKVPEKYKSHYL